MRKSVKLVFIAVWTLTLLFFSAAILTGFASGWMASVANFAYVAFLVLFFIDSNFFKERMNYPDPLVKLKGYDVWGLVLIIASTTTLLLFLGLKSSVIFVMALFTFVVSIWIIAKYRKQITRQLLIKGAIVGGLCSLAQYNYWPSLVAIFITVPFFYVSASLLNDKFDFTRIHFNNDNYSKLVKSFLTGCLFGLPMALSNLSDVMTTNPFSWINQFWQPVLAFNFVLLEETWVRLFIMTLIFSLVVSKTDKKYIAVLMAILISSVILGMTHHPHVDIQNCINIIFWYGLPLAVLFYKRDFETAVGFHFMINFASAVSTYAINSGLIN